MMMLMLIVALMGRASLHAAGSLEFTALAC